jgi:hypothetical protein
VLKNRPINNNRRYIFIQYWFCVEQRFKSKLSIIVGLEKLRAGKAADAS